MPADMLRLGGSTIFELHEQLNTKREGMVNNCKTNIYKAETHYIVHS